ncbi:MAG: TonB-dependent receptor [Gammaproteobacteria bacterium]
MRKQCLKKNRYRNSRTPTRPESPSRAGKRIAPLVMLALVTCVPGAVRAQGTPPSGENPSSSAIVNIGAVAVAAKPLNTLTKLPSKKHVFESTQSVKVIGKKQMAVAGPAGGAAQALAVAPGVNVMTEGQTGAPRTAVSINGMKTGWGNIAGNANDGTVMVTFDGVPMVDPSYEVWQASEVPQLSLIKGISVTYGPGYAVNRWYDNIGGAINFIPLQPTAKAGGTVGAFFGSYGTHGEDFSLRTGDIGDGWSGVLAGGVTQSSSNYLQGYGFDNPSSNYAYYAKFVDRFRGGHISFGAYTASAQAYRPVPIPVAPNAAVTINGANPVTGAPNPGPLYSQQTTGFYTTLPASLYSKQSIVYTSLLYSNYVNHVSRHVTLHNLIWYRYGHRQHLHYDNIGFEANVLDQYYYTTSSTYGDKLYYDIRLPFNDVSVGAYYLNNKYDSLLEFYNPSLPAQYAYGPNAGQNATVNGQPVNYSPSLPSHYHDSYLYMTDLAAFIQDDIQPIQSLRITPGIRFVSFQTNFVNNASTRFPVNVADLIGTNGDGTGGHNQPNASTTFREVEPSIGINWKVFKNVALYANYSTAYKAPAGATGTYAHLLASSLQPQKSTQYQVGLKAFVPHDGLLNDAAFGVNYYRLNDTNEIIPIPVVSHLYSLFASGSSDFSGVNLYFDDNPFAGLHVFSNVSFERATYQNYTTPSGGSYAGLPVSNVPAQTANIGVYYQLYTHGIVYAPRLWWQYTGAQDIYNNNTNAPTTQKLPAFGIWNASMKVSFDHQNMILPGLHQISLSLGVYNLLNKQYNAYEYISSGGYYGQAGELLGEPGAPRMVYVTLNAAF